MAGEAPPPSALARVHLKWDEVLMRAMRKEPAERFQSARELALALSEIAAELDPAAAS